MRWEEVGGLIQDDIVMLLVQLDAPRGTFMLIYITELRMQMQMLIMPNATQNIDLTKG